MRLADRILQLTTLEDLGKLLTQAHYFSLPEEMGPGVRVEVVRSGDEGYCQLDVMFYDPKTRRSSRVNRVVECTYEEAFASLRRVYADMATDVEGRILVGVKRISGLTSARQRAHDFLDERLGPEPLEIIAAESVPAAPPASTKKLSELCAETTTKDELEAFLKRVWPVLGVGGYKYDRVEEVSHARPAYYVWGAISDTRKSVVQSGFGDTYEQALTDLRTKIAGDLKEREDLVQRITEVEREFAAGTAKL